MAEKCPVCKTNIKTNDKACSVCGFADLHREFITIEDGELWNNEVVLPYRKKYQESKKANLNNTYDADGYDKDGNCRGGFVDLSDLDRQKENEKSNEDNSKKYIVKKKRFKSILKFVIVLALTIGLIFIFSNLCIGGGIVGLLEKYKHGDVEIHTRLFSGNVYKGELNEQGEREGWGKCTYLNGDVYEGEWIDDKFSDGKYIWKNGEVYEGHWAYNAWGYGVTHGVQEQGTFPHSRGKYTFKNGNLYDGEWEYGYRDGVGTMEYANGDVYSGMWNSNERHGYGEMKFANDEVYKGYWKFDEYIGK